MRNSAAASPSVSIRELPSVHVACVSYMAGEEPGDLHDEIDDRRPRMKSTTPAPWSFAFRCSK